MVFQNVLIVAGFRLSRKDITEFIKFILKKTENKIPEDVDARLLSYTIDMDDVLDRFKEMKIFIPPCCAEYNEFVVGFLIKKYIRLDIKCDKCKDFTCCKKCIGMTENGFYDIDSMFKDLTTINVENICKWCWNDERDSIKDKCSKCKFDKDLSEIINKRKIAVDERIRGFFGEKKMEYFSILDDCIYCS